MTGSIVALVFGALEYWLATAIGLSPAIGILVASQVAAVAGLLVWLGGVPGGGEGLGRHW
jgi:hypothetical protein